MDFPPPPVDAHEIAVLVVGDDELPIPRACVQLYAEGWRRPWARRADSEGVARFSHVPVARVTLQVQAEHWSIPPPEALDVPWSGVRLLRTPAPEELAITPPEPMAIVPDTTTRGITLVLGDGPPRPSPAGEAHSPRGPDKPCPRRWRRPPR